MENIGEGAEAILHRKGNYAVKERIRKTYRIPEIDSALRKSRTRKEARLLDKLGSSGFTPRLVSADEKSSKIVMEFVEGPKVRDILSSANCRKLCREIGEKVAELHNRDIIHSDLTTSNMILAKGGVRFVDLGLSFESAKAEDKAVDLHLLRQALDSRHPQIAGSAFSAVLAGYKAKAKAAGEVLQRLKKVELRGRNKAKGS